MASGAIIYEGPSLLDGAPIVVILTGMGRRSKNAKTGAMLQTWILRADMSPIEASKVGADYSICGSCPHRWHTGGGCYVILAQAPQAVYRTYKRGGYRRVALTELPMLGEGHQVRIGAYGDPGIVPAEPWEALLQRAAGHTGYTHQWRTRPDLKGLLMASVDGVGEMLDARDAGWRTFRIRESRDPLLTSEIACPASAEAGKVRSCVTCAACDGADVGKNRKASIGIVVHGAMARRFNNVGEQRV